MVTLLRQIEVAIAIGKATSQACKEAKVAEQTYLATNSLRRKSTGGQLGEKNGGQGRD